MLNYSVFAMYGFINFLLKSCDGVDDNLYL